MALLGAADGHVGVHDVVLLNGAEASREAATVLGLGVMPGQAHGEKERDQSHGQSSVSEGMCHRQSEMRPYLYSQTFTDIHKR